MKRDGNVPGDTGYIYNRASALLPHHRNHGLHGAERAENIRVEHFPARRHVDLRHRIKQPVPGVVYPDIDSLKMMQRQADGAFNTLAVPDVASQGLLSLPLGDAGAR